MLRESELLHLAVRRGGRVKATDGNIGTAGEFVIDQNDGHITTLSAPVCTDK